MDRLTDRRHKTAHCDVDVDVGVGGAGPGRRRRGRGARLGGEIRAEIGAGIASARAEAAACGADPAAAEAAARPRIEDSRAAFLMRRDNEAPRWLKHQGAYVRALTADGADGRVAELAAAAAVGIVRWGGPSCRPGDQVAVTGELAMAMAGRGRRRRNSTHGPCGGCTGARPGEVCVSMAGRTPGARAAPSAARWARRPRTRGPAWPGPGAGTPTTARSYHRPVDPTGPPAGQQASRPPARPDEGLTSCR